MFRKIKKIIKSKITGKVTLDVLVERGLRVGKNFSMLEGSIIDDSHCSLISIGDNVTFAPRVHILAHDASTKKFLGYTKIGKVSIGNNVFIGAGSIILPNVKIGNNIIIGAGSIVSKSLEDNGVYVGNPARFYCSTDKYLEKNRKAMETRPVFDETYTLRSNDYSAYKEEEMRQTLEDGIGYIV